MRDVFTINVVCTGNICRSPMAEVMLRDALDAKGVQGVVVESGGTGDWHVGGGADHRAEQVIARNGLDLSGHVAKQFGSRDFARTDLIIALDNSHVHTLNRLAPTREDREKIHLLRSFDPAAVEADDLEVNDPYYGDFRDFEITFEHITAALAGLVDYIEDQVRQRA